MLTVRYPNGMAVQYNSATFLEHSANVWHLYTRRPSEGGKWVASVQVSAGVIVESASPCAIYSKRRVITGIEEISFDKLAKDIRKLTRTVERNAAKT